jgi:adenylyl-sulfate kinase
VAENLTRQPGAVGRADRERLLGQLGCVVWMTGLSGSGKSTIARRLERRLIRAGRPTYVLDGDNIRQGLSGDLGFSPADRDENIRRSGEVAALFADAGLIAVAAFISPYRAGRRRARAAAPPGRFVEVFIDTPLAECERRDPKGLYRKARAGDLPAFTGIDAPYEPPETPELVVTTEGTPDQCCQAIEHYLRDRGLLSPPADRAPGDG